MPALRMKRKLNKVCQRSCCDLDCCKPIQTSEHSPSQVKTMVDTSIQIHQNGYLSSIVPSGCLLGIVPSNTEESGCNTVLTRFDETSTKLLDPSSPESETTTYSPNLEHGDFLLKSTNHSDEVKRESAELPNLVSDEGEDGNCDFTGYQTCSLFNLCFPECLPFLSFDSCMRFTDVSLSQLANSDILIDVAEKYMTPPFLDSTIEANHIRDIDSIQETLLNSNDVCSYFTTHQEFGINCLSGDLGETECYSPQLGFRTSPDLPQPVSSSCPTPSPKETREGKSITLVLDLDETLVHSTTEHCDDADFTFSIFSNMKECIVYVRRRPFLQMFLERVAEMFEVVIFTASQSIYAAQLLDILDPEHKIISRRIYRESCIALDGSWIKDLSILGIDLAKVVIIDNSPQVFRLQVNNGIPIKSWFDDPSDRALVQLLPFLETLVDAEDVRPVIAKEFGNKD